MDCSVRYWRFKEKGENVHLFCPILDKGVEGFREFRRIYKELKELERMFVGIYPNIVMYTKLEHTNIIRMITKVGYKPYFVNLEYNTIWFKKPLGGRYVW